MMLTACISLTIVLLIIVLLVKSLISSSTKYASEESPDDQRPRAVPINREEVGQRRGRRNVRARMRDSAARQQVEDEEDEDIDPLAEEIALPDGKLGVKKRRKLEMKAEKRAQRERDVEEREERKQRQTMLDEQRKIDDEKRKEEELQKEEEEKKLREEKERQEYEEYLKLKESFEIQEEGCEEEGDENVAKNKLQDFINYVKNNKVVLLEDLASQFQLKTQDCIDRVQDLLLQEQLVGVIDDRGKFIYITNEELEAVAKFINQRGRVSINELVDHSNSLINLQTDIKCET